MNFTVHLIARVSVLLDALFWHACPYRIKLFNREIFRGFGEGVGFVNLCKSYNLSFWYPPEISSYDTLYAVVTVKCSNFMF